MRQPTSKPGNSTERSIYIGGAGRSFECRRQNNSLGLVIRAATGLSWQCQLPRRDSQVGGQLVTLGSKRGVVRGLLDSIGDVEHRAKGCIDGTAREQVVRKTKKVVRGR
jgi:hypothetical protein